MAQLQHNCCCSLGCFLASIFSYKLLQLWSGLGPAPATANAPRCSLLNLNNSYWVSSANRCSRFTLGCHISCHVPNISTLNLQHNTTLHCRMQHAVYDLLKLLVTSPHSISSLLQSCDSDITTLSVPEYNTAHSAAVPRGNQLSWRMSKLFCSLLLFLSE